MRYALQNTIGVGLALSVMLSCQVTLAQEASASDAVRVKYDGGETVIAQWAQGGTIYTNRDVKVTTFPDEMRGLMFTARPFGVRAGFTIDCPPNTTVYLLVGKTNSGGGAVRKTATAEGWSKVGEVISRADDGNWEFLVYRLIFSQSKRVTLPGSGLVGTAVLARNLVVDTGSGTAGGGPETPAKTPPETPKKAGTDAPAFQVEPAPNTTPISGPTTRASVPQASIKSLDVLVEPETATILGGEVSEVVLTLTRGQSSKLTAVQFITPIGKDMSLARDEALRFIRLTYPNWYVDKAEITFEDKYSPHDGGSIGAAIGTMVLSVIEGFDIDPGVAITGDISANGKVRAIGGVSAKIRGAIAGKCSLVLIPGDNYDQLVDGTIYNGPQFVTDIQVIGISNLKNAVATIRTDRDPTLAQAIMLFSALQETAKGKPDYLTSKEAQEILARVLQLAPRHLSARILLGLAQSKSAKALSATASYYYISLAVRNMLAMVKERAESNQAHQVPSAVIRLGLADLRKLRPMADPNVRPLIDAWTKYIVACDDRLEGSGSDRAIEAARQLLIDEMVKENTNSDLMQKMLREGF